MQEGASRPGAVKGHPLYFRFDDSPWWRNDSLWEFKTPDLCSIERFAFLLRAAFAQKKAELNNMPATRMPKTLHEIIDEQLNSLNLGDSWFAVAIKQKLSQQYCAELVDKNLTDLIPTLTHDVNAMCLPLLSHSGASIVPQQDVLTDSFKRFIGFKYGIPVEGQNLNNFCSHFDFSLYQLNCSLTAFEGGADGYERLNRFPEIALTTCEIQEVKSKLADIEPFDLIVYGYTDKADKNRWVTVHSGFVTEDLRVQSYIPSLGQALEYAPTSYASAQLSSEIRIFRRPKHQAMRLYEGNLIRLAEEGQPAASFDFHLMQFESSVVLPDSAKGKQELLWARNLHARKVAPFVPLPPLDDAELAELEQPDADVEALAEGLAAVELSAKESETPSASPKSVPASGKGGSMPKRSPRRGGGAGHVAGPIPKAKARGRTRGGRKRR